MNHINLGIRIVDTERMLSHLRGEEGKERMRACDVNFHHSAVQVHPLVLLATLTPFYPLVSLATLTCV
jgi:hypothetical protein